MSTMEKVETGRLENLLVIAGPTASGKSRLAMDLAREVPLEIISADSMQVYRHMDIGTDKPSPRDRSLVAHHLLDLKNPDEQWSVQEFQQAAEAAIRDIRARGKIPAVVGGTGFYIRALLRGFPLSDAPPNPEFRREMQELSKQRGNEAVHELLRERDPWSWEHLHPNDLKRVVRALEYHKEVGRPISGRRETTPSYNHEYLMLGLGWDRQELYGRIDMRVDEQFRRGLIKEAEGLLNMGYSMDLASMNGLCYKESCMFLDGLVTGDECKELIRRNTRRYAKRQLTWLSREEGIIWIRGGNDRTWDDTVDEALQILKARRL